MPADGPGLESHRRLEVEGEAVGGSPAEEGPRTLSAPLLECVYSTVTMHARAGWLLGAALSLLAGPGSSAENLLVNPHFDEDLAGWSCEGSGTACSWQEEDPEDDPASGSGQVMRDGPGSFIGLLVQCVELPSTGLYRVAAELRTIAENGRNGQIDVAWFGEAGCSGPGVAVDILGVARVIDGWRSLEAELLAPEDALSLELQLKSFALDDESHTARIDAAFVPEPGPAAAGLAALAALGGLRALRTGSRARPSSVSTPSAARPPRSGSRPTPRGDCS